MFLKIKSRSLVSQHHSILYAPTISNKSIISWNRTHFAVHTSKYQFKLNKIRKSGGASLLDGILYTNRGETAALKWINELTQRDWREWPWLNTLAALSSRLCCRSTTTQNGSRTAVYFHGKARKSLFRLSSEITYYKSHN